MPILYILYMMTMIMWYQRVSTVYRDSIKTHLVCRTCLTNLIVHPHIVKYIYQILTVRVLFWHETVCYSCSRYDGEVVDEYQKSQATYHITEAGAVSCNFQCHTVHCGAGIPQNDVRFSHMH